MKITGISFEPRSTHSSTLRLATEAGLTGIAVCDVRVEAGVRALTRDVLQGEDARATAWLWERMADAHRPDPRAMAALDIALWDLKAKLRGEPLWKTLGAAWPRVNTHARLEAGTGQELGALRGALVVVQALDDAAGILGAAREKLSQNGAARALMLGSAATRDSKDWIRALRALEHDFDLTWVETPASRWDFLALRRVADSVATAVCVGRGLAVTDFLPHFHHRSVNVVQIDLSCTGVTGALRIADTAYGFELPVTLCAAPGNVGVHVGAVFPYCMSVEIADTTDGDVTFDSGWASCGDRPGTGLT